LLPWVNTSQSIILLMGLQIAILVLLLWALINYMPALLNQVFVDKQYLFAMSAVSLIYAALVSILHLTMSNQISVSLSYYAPVVLLISGALFHIDGQLNDYKKRMNLLSYCSFISYALSFLAIALSMNDEPIRNITLFMAVLLYARLVWLYRSLVPLYLVMTLMAFLHFDIILSDAILFIPGINIATVEQWYYLASLPLIGIFSTVLFFLRKSELQRNKQFNLTRHLFHVLALVSIILSTYSQWMIALNHYDLTSGLFLNIFNSLAILFSYYYWLKSNQINASGLLKNNSVYSLYLYVLLFLPMIQIILSLQSVLSMDIKMLMITMLIFYYSLNSRFSFMTFYTTEKQAMNRELFTNTSLLLSLLVLAFIASDFSVSIKVGILVFIISINFLLLSLSLLNQLLFYVFILIVSAAILIIKLYLHQSSSTGLLLLSSVFSLFYLIHWLDSKKHNEKEFSQLEAKKRSNPKFILWFYPSNDFSINIEEMKNV
jgi:hypothetical protein